MSEKVKKKKSRSIPLLNIDCWGHVVFYISRSSDFFNICLSVKGLYHYFVTFSSYYLENVEFVSRFDVLSGEKDSKRYVLRLKLLIQEYHVNKLKEKVGDWSSLFPNLRSLNIRHKNPINLSSKRMEGYNLLLDFSPFQKLEEMILCLPDGFTDLLALKVAPSSQLRKFKMEKKEVLREAYPNFIERREIIRSLDQKTIVLKGNEYTFDHQYEYKDFGGISVIVKKYKSSEDDSDLGFIVVERVGYESVFLTNQTEQLSEYDEGTDLERALNLSLQPLDYFLDYRPPPQRMNISRRKILDDETEASNKTYCELRKKGRGNMTIITSYKKSLSLTSPDYTQWHHQGGVILQNCRYVNLIRWFVDYSNLGRPEDYVKNAVVEFSSSRIGVIKRRDGNYVYVREPSEVSYPKTLFKDFCLQSGNNNMNPRNELVQVNDGRKRIIQTLFCLNNFKPMKSGKGGSGGIHRLEAVLSHKGVEIGKCEYIFKKCNGHDPKLHKVQSIDHLRMENKTTLIEKTSSTPQLLYRSPPSPLPVDNIGSRLRMVEGQERDQVNTVEDLEEGDVGDEEDEHLLDLDLNDPEQFDSAGVIDDYFGTHDLLFDEEKEDDDGVVKKKKKKRTNTRPDYYDYTQQPITVEVVSEKDLLSNEPVLTDDNNIINTVLGTPTIQKYHVDLSGSQNIVEVVLSIGGHYCSITHPSLIVENNNVKKLVLGTLEEGISRFSYGEMFPNLEVLVLRGLCDEERINFRNFPKLKTLELFVYSELSEIYERENNIGSSIWIESFLDDNYYIVGTGVERMIILENLECIEKLTLRSKIGRNTPPVLPISIGRKVPVRQLVLENMVVDSIRSLEKVESFTIANCRLPINFPVSPSYEELRVFEFSEGVQYSVRDARFVYDLLNRVKTTESMEILSLDIGKKSRSFESFEDGDQFLDFLMFSRNFLSCCSSIVSSSSSSLQKVNLPVHFKEIIEAVHFFSKGQGITSLPIKYLYAGKNFRIFLSQQLSNLVSLKMEISSVGQSEEFHKSFRHLNYLQKLKVLQIGFRSSKGWNGEKVGKGDRLRPIRIEFLKELTSLSLFHFDKDDEKSISCVYVGELPKLKRLNCERLKMLVFEKSLSTLTPNISVINLVGVKYIECKGKGDLQTPVAVRMDYFYSHECVYSQKGIIPKIDSTLLGSSDESYHIRSMVKSAIKEILGIEINPGCEFHINKDICIFGGRKFPFYSGFGSLAGYDSKFVDVFGSNILFYCVQRGRKYLLQAAYEEEDSDYDLNYQNYLGNTVLHVAYRFGQGECIQYLENVNGVDKFIPNDVGQIPQDLDPERENGKVFEEVLIVGAVCFMFFTPYCDNGFEEFGKVQEKFKVSFKQGWKDFYTNGYDLNCSYVKNIGLFDNVDEDMKDLIFDNFTHMLHFDKFESFSTEGETVDSVKIGEKKKHDSKFWTELVVKKITEKQNKGMIDEK